MSVSLAESSFNPYCAAAENRVSIPKLRTWWNMAGISITYTEELAADKVATNSVAI